MTLPPVTGLAFAMRVKPGGGVNLPGEPDGRELVACAEAAGPAEDGVLGAVSDGMPGDGEGRWLVHPAAAAATSVTKISA